jgi:hypothetical protein
MLCAGIDDAMFIQAEFAAAGHFGCSSGAVDAAMEICALLALLRVLRDCYPADDTESTTPY